MDEEYYIKKGYVPDHDSDDAEAIDGNLCPECKIQLDYIAFKHPDGTRFAFTLCDNRECKQYGIESEF